MENTTTATRLIEDCARLGPCKFALAVGALTFVCGAATWAATDVPSGAVVLWSGDDQWVKIEQQDDPAALPNDHPVQLGAEAITNALAALQVRIVDPDTSAESYRPVFTRKELENLAPQIASGLAKAEPRQDVTFSTIGSHALAAGGLVKDPGVNAGRVFYQGGKLNVIFGELQSNYRKKNVYGQRTEDFSPRRQGSRSKASKQKLTLATRSGVALHSASNGGVRNDWVTIDPAVVVTQTAAAPPAPQPATPSPASVAAPTAAAGAAKEPAASSASATTTGKSTEDIERRLQVLKDLKDKGLISEEAYNTKVQELLSEL